jgi:DNA-binding NtrC family response regulator
MSNEPALSAGGAPSSELLGESAAMARLRNYIGKIAATDSNVLITGETGTGKERVAQSSTTRARARGIH